MASAGSNDLTSGDKSTGTGWRAPADARANLQSHISIAELQREGWSGSVVDNAAFVPGPTALAAHADFSGVLKLRESEMTISSATLIQAKALGRDPTVFPGVNLEFFTVNGDLVPVTQDVIRSGSTEKGTSFWDIIVQPGQVWSELGDSGWSRAAFPFALMNSRAGSTHNGVALFLYRGDQISNVRYQIVQQTASSLVSNFCAAGSALATFEPARIENVNELAERYRASLANRVRFADWSELAAKVGADRLEGFDSALPIADGVAAGIDYRGTFYLQYCRSAGGSLPWRDRARFGVQSVTKVLASETALLRLVQKYGPRVFDLKIRDYVPAAAAHPDWESVRFKDAINMATGFGNGSACRDPNDALDGYAFSDPSNVTFYEARSQKEHIEAILQNSGRYPWGPGEVTRYRDQDMFILGVAMDNYLKSKEGPTATIWSMLEKEVYEPIGIYYAPTGRTVEADGRLGHPMMAYGYYPTLGDIVKIARLYQSGGRAAGSQILYPQGIEALMAGTIPRGLPTGRRTTAGETTYFNAFWETRYRASGGCDLYVPVMRGHGGNMVVLMPHELTAVRLAKNPDEVADPTSIFTTGDRIAAFCD